MAFTANIAQGEFSLYHHRIQTFRVIVLHVLTPGKMPFHISRILPAGPVQQNRRIPENSGVRLRKNSI